MFNFYQACLEATIENAKRDGKYDDGIVDISGTNVTLAEPPRTVLTVSLIQRNFSERPASVRYALLHPAHTSFESIDNMYSLLYDVSVYEGSILRFRKFTPVTICSWH